VHQQAFDEGVHRVLSISIVGQETAPPERGSITRPRSHQTRVCAATRTKTILLPVRGNSVKVPGPFGGAVGKTRRCGEWCTFRQLPPA
jgi:hypothetical protein